MLRSLRIFFNIRDPWREQMGQVQEEIFEKALTKELGNRKSSSIKTLMSECGEEIFWR
jgi:hypothetical protein